MTTAHLVPDDGLQVLVDDDRRTTELRRADPEILLTDEWMRRAGVTLDRVGDPRFVCVWITRHAAAEQFGIHADDVLHVHCDSGVHGGRAIYRLAERDEPRCMTRWVWPD